MSGSLFSLFKHKSDSFFMKERFPLFESKSLIFLSESYQSWGWKQILCSFKFIALLALLKRRCEWIALITLLKRLIHSFKKWKRAIHSYLSKNEQFARKTKELIPNPVLSCASWGKLWCFPFLKGGEMKVWVVSCLTPLMAVLCRFPWIQIREYCIFPPFYRKIPSPYVNNVHDSFPIQRFSDLPFLMWGFATLNHELV